MSIERIKNGGRLAAGLLLAWFLMTQAVWAQGPKQAPHSAAEGYSANKIIDHAVDNARGGELGEIDDLVVARNGRVKKAILSLGAFLGVGEKLISIPYRSLRIERFEAGKLSIVCKASRKELENRPEFSYSKAGLERGYYAILPQPRRPQGPNPQYYPPYSPPYGFPGYGTYAYYPARVLASVILGRAVIDDRQEALGEVNDLIINPRGRIKHIILSTGGILGAEKLVSLPFECLGFSDKGIVYRGVTKSQVENLPPIPPGPNAEPDAGAPTGS